MQAFQSAQSSSLQKLDSQNGCRWMLLRAGVDGLLTLVFVPWAAAKAKLVYGNDLPSPLWTDKYKHNLGSQEASNFAMLLFPLAVFVLVAYYIFTRLRQYTDKSHRQARILTAVHGYCTVLWMILASSVNMSGFIILLMLSLCLDLVVWRRMANLQAIFLQQREASIAAAGGPPLPNPGLAGALAYQQYHQYMMQQQQQQQMQPNVPVVGYPQYPSVPSASSPLSAPSQIHINMPADNEEQHVRLSTAPLVSFEMQHMAAQPQQPASGHPQQHQQNQFQLE